MPTDTSGNYSLPAGYLAVTGETIQASQHNPPLEDLQSAMTGRLPRNGAAAMTAPLKLTDGSASAPALSFGSAPTWGIYKTTTGIALAINGQFVVELGGIPSGFIVPCANIVAPAGFLLCYGQNLSRSTDSQLFEAITLLTTGDTNSNTTISGVADYRGQGLEGAYIESTGIFAGTTITEVGASTWTISQAAVTTTPGTTLRVLPHGQGDASTTFGIPDLRGNAPFGRDDMGGTAASRITSGVSGINGAFLGAMGGAQGRTITQGHLPSVNLTTTIGAGQGSHTHGSSTGANFLEAFNGGLAGPAGTSVGTGLTTVASATLPEMTGTTPLGGSGTTLPTFGPGKILNFAIKR